MRQLREVVNRAGDGAPLTSLASEVGEPTFEEAGQRPRPRS